MSNILQNKQGLKVLFTGAFLQLFLGIIYVWSVFKNPVSEHYGWEASAVGLTASFMLCFFVIGIFMGGKLQIKIGAKLTVLIGGLMVAGGMLATAFLPAGSPVFLIYLFYGAAGGFGVGAAYNAILSTAQKWFPQNRGFAAGISVCAFGFSTVIFAPLVTALNNKIDVNFTFMILAGIFALVILVFFNFIKTPEQTAAAAAPFAPTEKKQYTTTEMIKTLRFYLISLSLMFGTSVFFIINPDLTDIARDRGIPYFATSLVMFTGIFNALGRLGAPLMSDKIGREQADIIILAVTGLGAFALCFAQGPSLIVIIAAIAFCYGGYSGLYPVLTSENFGIKHIGSNYGAVMTGFMLSALLFPVAINRIEDRTLKFIVLGCFAILGALLVAALMLLNKRK